MGKNKNIAILLRGINVSGQKKIKMAEFRSKLEEAGFLDVRTYIQSGNVIVNRDGLTNKQIKKKIEQLIMTEYGYEVVCFVLEIKEIVKLRASVPFDVDVEKLLSRIYVTFLSEKPNQKQIELLQSYDYPGEQYELNDDYIYFYPENGAGRSKMSTNFFEKKLKVSATSRNIRTLDKIIELAIE